MALDYPVSDMFACYFLVCTALLSADFIRIDFCPRSLFQEFDHYIKRIFWWKK